MAVWITTGVNGKNERKLNGWGDEHTEKHKSVVGITKIPFT